MAVMDNGAGVSPALFTGSRAEKSEDCPRAGLAVNMDDETSRMVRSQNGDHAAFESLIKDYQRMIHSLCFRMTGSLADAEDLAQETFIQAYQHLGGFRAESRFSSWLYRI